MHVYFHSLCLSGISTLLPCCYSKDGKNRTILKLCCLHFPTVKKQPIISWWLCCDIAGDFAALDSAHEIFPPQVQIFVSFSYLPPPTTHTHSLFLLSPYRFHSHANGGVHGHPCSWWPKMLDPVLQHWTPRGYFPAAIPAWARELSSPHWGELVGSITC